VGHVGVIDTHAHIVPPALLDRLSRGPAGGFAARRTDAGWVISVPGTGDTRPAGPRMTDLAPRRDWLAKAGIDRQLLSPWLDIQDGPPGWVDRLNDAMAEAAAELGTSALASVALSEDGMERAAADAADRCAKGPFAGLVLPTDPPHGPALHEAAFDPLWTVAAELGLPVLLHPPLHGPSAALPRLGRAGNVFGRLIDTTLAVSRLILLGVFDRHPGLRLVLVHGGGFLPYATGRLDGGYRTGELGADPLERPAPSSYLDRLWFDTVTLSAPAIAFLTALAGPDHVLLGSDFPFPLGDPDPVGTVRAAALPPATERAVLHDTAASLFPALTTGSRTP
jgi:aminocarboxymuconate-semialdehyde decarboxylase